MGLIKDIRKGLDKIDHIGRVVAVIHKARKIDVPFDAEWRHLLHRALVDNRNYQGTGSGHAYWESVVDVVEEFLMAKRDQQNAA